MRYLRDVGGLWAESPKSLQREFVREVFQRITVEGEQINAIIPHPAYAPLFVLDRQERFGQRGPEYPIVVDWLPGQESGNHNYNRVPALILPDQTLRDVALG